MAHCLRHIIRDEKNDAIVHILLRIIDRFFEKALDQYYSQLSEAGQLDQKKKTKLENINGKTNKNQ